ncbi:EAL domain-containing response regulator, partial [bacterium]|nr:EAL domain-containing response regulator [bacterium]
MEELGFRYVSSVTSGEDALKQLDAGLAPEVIFCDLNMPGMDGVELIRHLARRQFAGGVVLVSGEDWRILKTCEEMGSAFGLQLLGTLQKPFNPDEISRLLARVSSLKVAPLPKTAPIAPDELREAIEAGQMAAWFQPQLSVATRTLVAVEALVRWRHPQRGLIPPMAFIPVAEEHGLIDALLEKVYRDAMAHVGRWHQQGMDLRVSVNLSTDNLRLKGFGLSIDDFGTGYSSMEQLHRMPFTELKIDRGFVHGATSDSRSRAVFESSVQLARKLSMTTVAEGVENEDDFRLAQEIGCDLVQGYHFAKPMSAEALQAWIVNTHGVDKPG